MADLSVRRQAFFDRGIDLVVDTPEAAMLPMARELQPSGLASPTALDDILSAARLEALLDTYSLPALSGQELMNPVRFRAALEAVLAFFSHALDTNRASQPGIGERIAPAIRVLSEELELRELLQMYRRSLVPG